LYRDVEAPVGTVLLVEIAGDCGGRWFLSRGTAKWDFVNEAAAKPPASRAKLPQDLAWRLFTKGVAPERARKWIEVEGDQDLGEKVLHLTSIVG